MAKKTKYPNGPRRDNPNQARESRSQQRRKPRERSDSKRSGMKQSKSSDMCSIDIHSLAVRMYCAIDRVADYVDALRVVPFDDREEVQAYCEEFRNALRSAYADLIRMIADLERAFSSDSEHEVSNGIVIAFPPRGDRP